MKVLFSLICPVILLLAACDNSPKNPVAEHGDRMIKAYDRSKDLRDEANIKAIQTSLQAYHAANSKYPETLAEIGNMIGSPVDFSKYDYNPQTGSVTLKKQ